MSCSDLAGVFFVIIEILIRQDSVLVTDQSVGGDQGGIEFDLNFDIFGDRHQRAGQLIDQHLFRFAVGVDERIISVSLSADLLQHRVVQVSHPKS